MHKVSLLLHWAQTAIKKAKSPVLNQSGSGPVHGLQKRNQNVESRLVAEVLLSPILKCSRIELYKDYDQSVNNTSAERYKRAIRKYLHGYPVSYLTGEAEFMSLRFKIVPGIIIPRPETEFVVEEALRIMKGYKNPKIIVEIGTGCGNIIISLAQLIHAKNIRFFASDISRQALKLAQENAIRHNLDHHITFCYGNLFRAFEPFGLKGEIDLLVSNPPYVSQKEFARLPINVKNYEPRQALLAGKTGLEFHKRIITESAEYLKPSGYLVLEMGYNQSKIIKELIESTGYFDRINFVKDLQGIKRVISARLE